MLEAMIADAIDAVIELGGSPNVVRVAPDVFAQLGPGKRRLVGGLPVVPDRLVPPGQVWVVPVDVL